LGNIVYEREHNSLNQQVRRLEDGRDNYTFSFDNRSNLTMGVYNRNQNFPAFLIMMGCKSMFRLTKKRRLIAFSTLSLLLILVATLFIYVQVVNTRSRREFDFSALVLQHPRVTANAANGHIHAVGVDGNSGYITVEDFNRGRLLGWTQSESVDYQTWYDRMLKEAIRNGETYIFKIPLYAEDGITIIGEFGFTQSPP